MPRQIEGNATFQRLVRDLLHAGFITWSDDPFTLKSGVRSHVYVNGRNDLTERPLLLREVGRAIGELALEHCPPSKQLCLIGIPTAGSALAQAGSFCFPSKIIFRPMRSVKKGHGKEHAWVDGAPSDQHAYMTVDNVITDGKSKFETIDRLREDGYPVDDMIHLVLVDRDQGGSRVLEDAGVRLESVFSLLGLARYFASMGLWSSEQADQVRKEVEAHQFDGAPAH
jgi:orotate phosphoribosyltransferase